MRQYGENELEALRRPNYDAYKDPDVVASAIVEKRHAEFKQINAKTPQRLNEDNILHICQRRLWLPSTRTLLENKQTHLNNLLRQMENELQNQINSSTGSESEDVLENRIKNGLERWAEWFSSSFLCNAHLQVSHLPNRGKRQPRKVSREFSRLSIVLV